MNLERPCAASRISTLIDAAMDSYVDWRQESAAVELAYRRCQQAASHDRDRAFDEYLAALDREEQAANEYQSFIERAGAAARGGVLSS